MAALGKESRCETRGKLLTTRRSGGKRDDEEEIVLFAGLMATLRRTLAVSSLNDRTREKARGDAICDASIRLPVTRGKDCLSRKADPD